MNKQEHRNEIYAYIVSGVLCAIVNLGSYQGLLLCGMDYKAANAISLILSKLSAYLLNKSYVFHAHCSSWGATIKEMIKFFAVRGATGMIDFFGLILLVEIFAFPPLPSKYFMMGLVIVLNYVFSKRYVFHGRKSDHGTE